jgi:uncharacterized protein YbbK (DUF523 family)
LLAISACLLGIACRYDGRRLPSPERYPLDPAVSVVPICPEQLGGLPTPRPAAQISSGSGEDVLDGRARVLDDAGRDCTAAFVRGAQETLRLCSLLGVRRAVLKSESPSCGVGTIHRGGACAAGDGVTAALLRREGIAVSAYPDGCAP